MIIIYEGQNLRSLCTIAKGYFRILLDFYLINEYATRKPPIKKNTSTDKNVAIVIK